MPRCPYSRWPPFPHHLTCGREASPSEGGHQLPLFSRRLKPGSPGGTWLGFWGWQTEYRARDGKRKKQVDGMCGGVSWQTGKVTGDVCMAGRDAEEGTYLGWQTEEG